MILSEILHNDKPAFHGELKENERIVPLRPPLAASDKDELGGASKNCFLRGGSLFLLPYQSEFYVVNQMITLIFKEWN